MNGLPPHGPGRMASPEDTGLYPFVSKGEGGWYVLVRVQPGAKKNEFSGLMDGRLRVRLAAPAVENKANKALVAFIAKALGLKAARVSLLSGETGRQKRLFIASEDEPDWTRFGHCTRE